MQDKKTEKQKKETLKFLELLGDLILLIDGYRIFRLKNYKTLNYRINKQNATKKLGVNWKKTIKILERMSEIPILIPGVQRLKKIQIITSWFGTAQFAIIMVGFMLSRWGVLSERLGPVLFVSLIGAAFIPLIGVFVTRKISLKVQDYYYKHPQKFRFKISSLKRDVQTLLDLLRDELGNKDIKTKNKYGILKMANADYKGIKALKSPGGLRKLYWIKIVEN